uniref:Uncharacterized protein n=1 Tax=Haptolina brevifila TaxID=156173 RepID=A0A7S2DNH2_9EUKA|mmetsp:Transcript_40450/g.81052  ORF Transcript_40450/g.81052 Transcript_40450/m.81052 type:complete len:177 (+) Transcript_40450:112-642(+)
MNFCPVPHTTRENVWLGIGVAAGVAISRLLVSRPESVTIATPKRIFKLCVSSELEGFDSSGQICSTLDATDGFIHLSDRTSPPKVASLFFSGAADLWLLEIDASLLAAPVKWIVGVMGDAPPSASVLASSFTTVHYLMADGCVHVYGPAGVSMSAVVRRAKVPLGKDGVHIFPDWL